MPKGRVYKTKSKGAQEAHESIRPTSFRRDPDSLAGLAAARRAPPVPPDLAARARVPDGGQGARDDDGRAGRRRRTSSGRARRRRCSTASRAVYTEGRDDGAAEDEEAERRLPALAEGDATTVRDVTPTQHFTEPPPRFTEATLIKALEEHGIGRPSTYAATISTIVDRGYVRVEERRLHPELVGEVVTDLLVEHFGDYVDLAFTARMEEELDEVARGERAWVPLLARVLRPARATGSTRSPQELKRERLHDRGDRRGLLGGPPDGDPARAERPVPRLLAVPGAQGVAAAARRRGAAPGRRGRGLPAVRRGDARRQARPVRAVRRLLALPGLHATSRRRARRRRIRCRSRSPARRTTTATSSPRRARRTGNVF